MSLAEALQETSLTPSTPAPATSVSPQDKVKAQQVPEPPDIPEPEVEAPAVVVALLDGGARIEGPNGRAKFISHEDLAEIMLSFLKQSEESRMTSPTYLPEGVMYYETGANSMYMLLYYPETVQTVKYRDRWEGRCKVPNIVIGLTLIKTKGAEDGWEVTDSFYAATSLSRDEIERKRLTSSLFGKGFSTIPFTNIYDNGKMCFGSNPAVMRASKNDFRVLSYYYNVLWSSPYNDDLGIYALKSDHLPSSYLDWFKELAKLADDNKPFPYNKLRM